jgi:spore coat protein CotH
MREAGAVVPRVGFAKVYVNDEYWGLYLLVEQIDKTFLDAHLTE